MPPPKAKSRAGQPSSPAVASPKAATTAACNASPAAAPQRPTPPPPPPAAQRKTSRRGAEPPEWLYVTVAAFFVALVALSGTAYMIATPEERAAVWSHKGALLSATYWRAAAAEGLEAARHLFAGDDGAELSDSMGKGDPSLSTPQAREHITRLGGKPIDRAPPPAPTENARLKAKQHTSSSEPPSPATGVQAAEKAAEKAKASSPLTCFTLEAYSDRFVASARQIRQGKHLYRCGTRLVDLRTADAEAPETLACAEAAATAGDDASVTSHVHLRVVLTPKEVEWHTRQKLNLGVEVFPLSYLNDDYCDCLDGTDEVLTGACSMSGPGMPLGRERWRAHVVANKDVVLYEDQLPDAPVTGTKAKRLSTAQRAKSLAGNGVDVLGGPVLPFPCTADPETWLSPTMLGDGIPDCCDGSDERDVTAWATGSGRPATTDTPPPVEWQAMFAAWQRQRAAQTQALLPVNYSDSLHPYWTSAAALLVDKGYTGLFACPTVHQQRLDTAVKLLDLTRTGHDELRQREMDGWERLGSRILENQTFLSGRLGNITREMTFLKNSFTDRMEKAQVRDPIAAGITVEEMQHYEGLVREHGMLEQEAAYLGMIATQRVFGEHYEYYPLFTKTFTLRTRDVVNSFATDAVSVRRQRAKLRMPVQACLQRHFELSQYDRYAEAAQAQGMAVRPRPPPLHVDNISLAAFGIIPARFGLLAQRVVSDGDAEMVARSKGLVHPDAPFDRAALAAKYDGFTLAPTYPLGHWQPYRVDRSASAMAVLDPAGDVDLPRRFSVAPTTRLTRGGGRLQTPTRKTERDRTFTVTEESLVDGKPKLRTRPPGSGEEEEDSKNSYEIPLAYHRNTPNILATHHFDGGSLRCGLDEHDVFTSMRVAYGCAERDEVLAWARNGKCQHEVVIGTPSACTRWVLRDMEDRVSRYRALVDTV